jgi:LmbE family N-acetylglucosaminyl deacetylase
VAAAGFLLLDRPGRPVVLLLSDGIDNVSFPEAPSDRGQQRLQRETERALQRVGVSIDFVAVPRTYDLRLDDSPPGDLRPETIARATGGERFDAHDEDLARKLAARLDELRASYVITYTPQGVGRDDGWHDVEIRLVGREGTVRARPGYFAGGDIP